MPSDSGPHGNLHGVRVVEIADEQAEYCGLLLSGLGAEVVKVEPPEGNPTRQLGPFYGDVVDPERSLYFWQYNRGKKSITLDPNEPNGRERLADLLRSADVLLHSCTPNEPPYLGLTRSEFDRQFPHLIVAHASPYGDEGPWSGYRGSDLVHLALGGVLMNCGYDPMPDGTYDIEPMAPQAWHAYHIVGEQLTMGIIGALLHRRRTGQSQLVTCAVHEAVAKNTELDLMNWVMRRQPLYRQTCRHAAEVPSAVPSIAHTKDGRWFTLALIGPRDRQNLVPFLDKFGMAADLVEQMEVDPAATKTARRIPGSGGSNEQDLHQIEVAHRFVRKYSYSRVPWREAQEAGLIFVPLRKPHENITDEHWQRRGTFSEVYHPEFERSFTYATSRWVSDTAPWIVGRRAPLLGEDTNAIVELESPPVHAAPTAENRRPQADLADSGATDALSGVRILDFTWFLASAGGTRFLAALGAESIKVEWHEHPDTRFGAMAPVGGRKAREAATSPLPGVTDSDMGGQFNNKNAGKRGISLNVWHPEGLAIARRLVAISDIVAEGFSPGVMDSWGLGYDALRRIKPDIIYAQQSGMGSEGTYGRFRAVGPVAAAFAGTSEMSGLAEPAMPAGWGYSYLDWIGAYSFATAMLAALYRRDEDGLSQHIDASQCETGIFIAGPAVLDWSANAREWTRYGNRSPYKPAAPHGVYRCSGRDRWIAIACFEDDWTALAGAVGHQEWALDDRFATLDDRLAHNEDLDTLVGEWTRGMDAYDAMRQLQAAGIAAGVCQTAEDRCEDDPQLAHLDWLTEVTGTKIGTWPVAEVPFKMSETPPHIGGPTNRGAPCYGEDNEYVFGDLLGMSSREIARLADDGAI